MGSTAWKTNRGRAGEFAGLDQLRTLETEKGDGMKRKRTIINIEVDEALHLRLRLLTIKRRTSMRAIVNDLIREYLEREDADN